MIRRALFAVVILSASSALAAVPLDSTRDLCESTADLYASAIVSPATKAAYRTREVFSTAQRERRLWLNSVRDYMYQSAETSTLNQRQLYAIGYAYCIERRPASAP